MRDAGNNRNAGVLARKYERKLLTCKLYSSLIDEPFFKSFCHSLILPPIGRDRQVKFPCASVDFRGYYFGAFRGS